MIDNIFDFFFGSFPGFIAFIFTVLIYFLPTIIAFARHKNFWIIGGFNILLGLTITGGILFADAFLGLTFFGWMLALVWSVKK
ncbi:Superinfection immunity protein [Dehalogenimonas formicexedens]|uniref:Superinfection immunity protein n=1 Tax=Dehalogenimonas formicexedens TaxID=1839801 RepID=A0A1P8F927_9CHLR|nr:superinfection immunity protein [Dehalogenimonas formicexedens]APV44964.1 Superinfection immunity protein [Dehalogenimonas formicexedens]